MANIPELLTTRHVGSGMSGPVVPEWVHRATGDTGGCHVIASIGKPVPSPGGAGAGNEKFRDAVKAMGERNRFRFTSSPQGAKDDGRQSDSQERGVLTGSCSSG